MSVKIFLTHNLDSRPTLDQGQTSLPESATVHVSIPTVSPLRFTLHCSYNCLTVGGTVSLHHSTTQCIPVFLILAGCLRKMSAVRRCVRSVYCKLISKAARETLRIKKVSCGTEGHGYFISVKSLALNSKQQTKPWPIRVAQQSLFPTF